MQPFYPKKPFLTPSSRAKHNHQQIQKTTNSRLSDILIHYSRLKCFKSKKKTKTQVTSKLLSIYDENVKSINNPKATRDMMRHIVSNNTIKDGWCKQEHQNIGYNKLSTSQQNQSVSIQPYMACYISRKATHTYNNNINFHTKYKSQLNNRKQTNSFRDLMSKYRKTIDRHNHKSIAMPTSLIQSEQIQHSYMKYKSFQSLITPQDHIKRQKQADSSFLIINRSITQARDYSLKIIPVDYNLRISGDHYLKAKQCKDAINKPMAIRYRQNNKLKVGNTCVRKSNQEKKHFNVYFLEKYKFGEEEEELMIEPWEAT